MSANSGLSSYSPEQPLVLLTDYPPDTGGGGAVILRSLLGPEERRSIVWMSPMAPSDPAAAGPNVVTLKRGSQGKGRRSIAADTTIYANKLAAEVLDEAKKHNARAIWVVMHNAVVAVAAALIRRGNLPVHLTVHDDPAFANALRSKRYFALIPWIEHEFAFTMRHAQSIDVIGQGMAERYRKRFGVDSVIVHRALDEPIAQSPAYDRSKFGLRVGVLGSTYSYDQLPLIARAVELAAKRLAVPGRLLIVGRSHGERLKAEMSGRVEVDVTGHISEADAIPLLHDCFALYLNYPFGRRDAVLRQTSFPTKLSTYIQAARPLLLHVPPDSSVMPLISNDGFATAWTDLDIEHGAETLVAAWNDSRNQESRHIEAEAVRQTYYHPARNRETLFTCLNALCSPCRAEVAAP